MESNPNDLSFGPGKEGVKYHAFDPSSSWYLANAPDRDLEKWGTDPNCFEMEACANALAERRAKRDDTAEPRIAGRQLQDSPFDPRKEVSADGKYIAGRIVTHLWILFVLLPILAYALLWLSGAIK